MSRRAVFVCAGLTLVFALLGWRVSGRRNTGDLAVYYHAGERLRAGLDLYVLEGRDKEHPSYADGYIYLPPLATILMPVSLLPYPLVRGLWFFVMAWLAARTFVASWWLVQRVGVVRGPPTWAVFAVGALVSLRFVWSDLGHGQVNILVFWLTVEGIVAAERKRDGLAGVLFAAAVVLKITPAVVVAAYLLRGRWRIGVSGALAGLTLLLLPGLVIGFGLNAHYIGHFVSEVMPWHSEHAPKIHNNVGLAGAVTHLLVGTNHGFGHPHQTVWLNLDPALVRGARTALSLCLLLLTLGLAWRYWGADAGSADPSSADPSSPDADTHAGAAKSGPGHIAGPPSPERAQTLALLVASVPLISPVAWKPHLALLIFPGLVAGKLLFTPGRHRVPLAIGCACLALTGRMLLGRTLANGFSLWGGVAVGLLLLYGTLALARTPGEPLAATTQDDQAAAES